MDTGLDEIKFIYDRNVAMSITDIDSLYGALKTALAGLIEEHDLAGKELNVRCRVLEAAEAIGTPEHKDYPILKGREHMVEARMENARGQAFADEFENFEGPVDSLLTMELDTNSKRAIFIAGLNAAFKYCKKCGPTVHCKDDEPVECAKKLHEIFSENEKILLAGLQPRFLEELSKTNSIRTVDLDPENIGTVRYGVKVEPPENTEEAIEWCDTVFATGSTVVNGTITDFLKLDKRVVFFGVTIAAAASILGLEVFCNAPER